MRASYACGKVTLNLNGKFLDVESTPHICLIESHESTPPHHTIAQRPLTLIQSIFVASKSLSSSKTMQGAPSSDI